MPEYVLYVAHVPHVLKPKLVDVARAEALNARLILKLKLVDVLNLNSNLLMTLRTLCTKLDYNTNYCY